jgi:sugar phosphate isomerase/epimerase
MKLSFGSWAFTRGPFADNPLSLHRVLHKLEDEGYRGIELGAVAPHPTPDSHPSRHKRDHVKKEIAEHGLAFSGMAPDLRSHKLVSVEDCGPYVAAFARYVLFAEDLGIPAIRVDTVEPTTELAAVDPKRIFDRTVKAFNLCAKIAADRGMRVCWEFEPHLPINTPAQITALVDAVRGLNNPNFGVLFDSSHAHVCAAGAELDLLRSLKGKINHVHLADSDGTVDDHGVSRHLPLGAGRIDFGRLLPELQQSGLPDDWWVIDLYNCPDAWDAVATAKQYLTSRVS